MKAAASFAALSRARVLQGKEDEKGVVGTHLLRESVESTLGGKREKEAETNRSLALQQKGGREERGDVSSF